MKVPRRSGDTGAWERMIARFLTANKVPVEWSGAVRRFIGLHGYTIRRIAPMRARYDTSQALHGLPVLFRASDDPNLIVIVTNAHYGDNLEDSLVVLRLGTFTPIFATHINNDRERYISNAANSKR